MTEENNNTNMIKESFILLILTILIQCVRADGLVLHKCCSEGQTLNRFGACEIKSNATIIDFPSVKITYEEEYAQPCEFWDMLILDMNYTEKVTILGNGSLVLRAMTARGSVEKTLFDKNEFCVDISHTSKVVVKMCPCEKLICLRKCCPFGYMYNFNRGERCIQSSESTWQPTLLLSANSSLQDIIYEVLDARVPNCKGFHNFASTAYIPPTLLNSFWWEYPTGKAFHGRRLCKDLIAGTSFEMSIICEEVVYWDRILKYVWHVPATFLLSCTLITLVTLPELRTGTHGRALFCHVIALLVLNIALSINAKYTFFGLKHETYVILRKFTDVVVHYAVWSAAFWLNVICINIAGGFKTKSMVKRPDKDRRKMMFFRFYAWGFPAIITSVIITLRVLPNTYVPFLFKPTLIETRSGHYELEGILKYTSFAYYFGPMLLLLMVNLSLFGFTSKKVWSLKRESMMITSGHIARKERQQNQNRVVENTKSVLLYVRLLCLMGVLELTLELVAWASSHYFWYEAIMDAVDLLRASCVCALTCCKRRVLRSLRARLAQSVLLLRLRRIDGEGQKRRSYEIGSMGTGSTGFKGRNASTSSSSTHRSSVVGKEIHFINPM